MAEDDKNKPISVRKLIINAPNHRDSSADELYHFDSKEEIGEDTETDSGIGGATGKIEFRYRDAMSLGNRDDLLPAGEIKRLLIVHKDLHKQRVDKQKATRQEREMVKDNKYIARSAKEQLGRGGGSGGSSPYKTHPISAKAQWSGVDKQMIGIPSLNEANTNDELKDKLENKLQNRLQNQPKFNPRPRFPG